jgi:hypothetical protein
MRGISIGAIDGIMVGQIVGMQIGGMSRALLHNGCISPLIDDLETPALAKAHRVGNYAAAALVIRRRG